MKRILLCDDHAIVREGLKQILVEQADIQIVGEASSGEETLKLLRTIRCDIVVLDIAMSGMGGIETLRELKRLHPNVSVLMLSMYPEDQYAVRSLQAGASGYLTKHSASEELVKAINTICAEGRYVTPLVADSLLGHLDTGDKAAHESLSDRELQVLIMLASGRSVSDIASDLHLSVKTVSTYKTRILDKLQLNGIAEMVRYAMKHQLIS